MGRSSGRLSHKLVSQPALGRLLRERVTGGTAVLRSAPGLAGLSPRTRRPGSTRTRHEMADVLHSCTGISYTPPTSYSTKLTWGRSGGGVEVG